MNTLRLTLTLSMIAVSAITLSGCGKKADATTATQVAAKVGSEEISIHQINQLLGRVNAADTSPEAVQAMSRQILENLIDQQLAVDQATEVKLHRSPEVVAQIESAKRDILARAYLQQLTGNLPKPALEDQKKYYAANPALFAQRRVFNLQEVVAKPGAEATALLKTMGDAGRPVEEIAAALKAKNIPFSGGNVTRSSDQLPLEILPTVNALKDGQNFSYTTAQSANLIHVVSSQAAPVSEEQALPRIEKFLANKQASEAIASNFKALREKTKITYLGDFAQGSSASPTPTPTAAPADAAAPQTPVEKGVSGLK